MATLAKELLSTVKTNPDGWNAFTARLHQSGNLETALQDIHLSEETLTILIRATWHIIAAADLKFYRSLLIHRSHLFPLKELFRYLLRTAQASISVITTNYDRVAEYAANSASAYACTGMTDGWINRFAANVVGAKPIRAGYEGTVAVLKVHGSLDWFRDSSGDLVGLPQAQEIPDAMRPLIVTPGVSKYQQSLKDPFRTILSSVDNVLERASCYMCIGYGFNDEHVQPVLVRRVKKYDIPLLILTKKLTEQVRTAFLIDIPKRFLFIEEAPRGTKIYTPDTPNGTVLADTSIWKLEDFMKMITAEGRR